jgi:hypothetical protein
MYSSSPEDMKAVVSYIDQHDMAALDRQAVSRAISRAVTVEASAAHIKAVFQVQLSYFEVIILPGGHIVSIDPWDWRALSQVLTTAQASERLTGRAKIQIMGNMYKDSEKTIERGMMALRESKQGAGN